MKQEGLDSTRDLALKCIHKLSLKDEQRLKLRASMDGLNGTDFLFGQWSRRLMQALHELDQELIKSFDMPRHDGIMAIMIMYSYDLKFRASIDRAVELFIGRCPAVITFDVPNSMVVIGNAPDQPEAPVIISHRDELHFDFGSILSRQPRSDIPPVPLPDAALFCLQSHLRVAAWRRAMSPAELDDYISMEAIWYLSTQSIRFSRQEPPHRISRSIGHAAASEGHHITGSSRSSTAATRNEHSATNTIDEKESDSSALKQQQDRFYDFETPEIKNRVPLDGTTLASTPDQNPTGRRVVFVKAGEVFGRESNRTRERGRDEERISDSESERSRDGRSGRHGLQESKRLIQQPRQQALHAAAQGGHNGIVKTLLKLPDIDINAQSAEGRTPLHLAARYGHLDVLKTLIEQPGIDINAQSVNGSTLHLAIRHGHMDIVMVLLIDHEALQVSDYQGWTPLHGAIDQGHIDIANLLLDNGADVDTINVHGDTPLAAAAQDGQEELVEKLLARGARIS